MSTNYTAPRTLSVPPIFSSNISTRLVATPLSKIEADVRYIKNTALSTLIVDSPVTARGQPRWSCVRNPGASSIFSPSDVWYDTNLITPVNISVDLATGIITCLIPGRYFFSFHAFFDAANNNGNLTQLQLYKNNNFYQRTTTNKLVNGYKGVNMYGIVDLARFDYLQVKFVGATGICPLAPNLNCNFSGVMIG